MEYERFVGKAQPKIWACLAHCANKKVRIHPIWIENLVRLYFPGITLTRTQIRKSIDRFEARHCPMIVRHSEASKTKTYHGFRQKPKIHLLYRIRFWIADLTNDTFDGRTWR